MMSAWRPGMRLSTRTPTVHVTRVRCSTPTGTGRWRRSGPTARRGSRAQSRSPRTASRSSARCRRVAGGQICVAARDSRSTAPRRTRSTGLRRDGRAKTKIAAERCSPRHGHVRVMASPSVPASPRSCTRLNDPASLLVVEWWTPSALAGEGVGVVRRARLAGSGRRPAARTAAQPLPLTPSSPRAAPLVGQLLSRSRLPSRTAIRSRGRAAWPASSAPSSTTARS